MSMEQSAEKRRNRSNLLLAALGFLAVVMLWRAVWDLTAEFMSPVSSLIVGLVLVAGIGYIERGFIYKLL